MLQPCSGASLDDAVTGFAVYIQKAIDRPAEASNCMNRLPVNLATQPPEHKMVPSLSITVP